MSLKSIWKTRSLERYYRSVNVLGPNEQLNPAKLYVGVDPGVDDVSILMTALATPTGASGKPLVVESLEETLGQIVFSWPPKALK